MNEEKFIPPEFNRLTEKQMILNSKLFPDEIRKRRTVMGFLMPYLRQRS